MWRTASQQYTALEKLVGVILLSSEMWIRIFLGMLQNKCGLSLRINVWHILGSTGTVSVSTVHEPRCLVLVVGTVLLLWFYNKLAHCIAIHAVRFKNA